MFPFDIDDEEIELNLPEETEPSDFEIDFETGRLTGRVITGLEWCIQWARIVLTTDRYFYPQYSWDHGVDFNRLIGQNYDENYIKSEVKRMVEEALMVNEYILGIDDLECSLEKDVLTIKFTINTIFGGGEISV